MVTGYQRSWLDCADARADMARRCAHNAEDTFHMLRIRWNLLYT